MEQFIKSLEVLLPTHANKNILELITLDGEIRRKIVFTNENELEKLHCCSGGIYFYRMSRQGHIWKTGTIKI